MTDVCRCIRCEFDRAKADRAPGRRNLRPMFSPVAVTRDAAAGGSIVGCAPGDHIAAPPAVPATG